MVKLANLKKFPIGTCLQHLVKCTCMICASNGTKNGAQRSVRVFPFMSVTARRSVDTCDDKVVSEYEED